MGGHHRLITPAQQLVSKFHANLVGQLRRHFALGKTLNKVVSLHTAGLMPAQVVGAHIGKSGLTQAAQTCLKADGFGFVPVEGIVHRFFQGTWLCGFGFIPHILYRPVQAAHGNEGCVGHAASPVFLDQAVNLCRQRRHLVHALLPGHACGVGAVGELVGVVAQARHLAQQVGMVGAGARVEFAPMIRARI